MAEIKIKRGDTLRIFAVFNDPSTGAPRDMTGCGLSVKIVRPETGAAMSGATIMPTDEAAGVFDVIASAGATSAWPVGTFAGQVRVTYPDGFVETTETFYIDVEASL